MSKYSSNTTKCVKKGYDTREIALVYGEFFTKEYEHEGFSTYKCKVCKFWHVSHIKKSIGKELDRLDKEREARFKELNKTFGYVIDGDRLSDVAFPVNKLPKDSFDCAGFKIDRLQLLGYFTNGLWSARCDCGKYMLIRPRVIQTELSKRTEGCKELRVFECKECYRKHRKLDLRVRLLILIKKIRKFIKG